MTHRICFANKSLVLYSNSLYKNAQYVFNCTQDTIFIIKLLPAINNHLWPLNLAFPNSTQRGHKIIANHRSSNLELKLTTIHCKCSQTHRVSLPSSSQNLAAECPSKRKRTIANHRSSNFQLKFTTIHCKCSQTHQVSLPSSSQNLAANCPSKRKRTISNHRSSNFELRLATIHWKCSQTHRISLPSDTQ